jgi:hypothetical protein
MRDLLLTTGNRVTWARCASTGRAGTGSGVVSRGLQVVISSTFLRPLAPPALPGFVAPTGALTPERAALLTGRFRTSRNPAHEHRLGPRPGLFASCARRGRLVRRGTAGPMRAAIVGITSSINRPRRPSDHSTSKHLTAPVIALSRYPSASRASDTRRSGLRRRTAGSPVSPAESSSLTLRTGRSPPVASHPLSPRRSDLQIQAGERLPEKDFHLSDQTHLQTHIGVRKTG